jgi:hypothetical protein
MTLGHTEHWGFRKLQLYLHASVSMGRPAAMALLRSTQWFLEGEISEGQENQDLPILHSGENLQSTKWLGVWQGRGRASKTWAVIYQISFIPTGCGGLEKLGIYFTIFSPEFIHLHLFYIFIWISIQNEIYLLNTDFKNTDYTRNYFVCLLFSELNDKYIVIFLPIINFYLCYFLEHFF